MRHEFIRKEYRSYLKGRLPEASPDRAGDSATQHDCAGAGNEAFTALRVSSLTQELRTGQKLPPERVARLDPLGVDEAHGELDCRQARHRI